MLYKLMTISVIGTCSAETEHSSVRSYDGPDEFLKTDRLEAGAAVLDLRPIADLYDEGEVIRMVIAAPMVDFRLHQGQIKRIGDLMPAGDLMWKVAENFGFDETAIRADTDPPGPLDYVSLPTYLAYWRSRGARIGIWNGKIDWEEE
jgi:hypothetical protein